MSFLDRYTDETQHDAPSLDEETTARVTEAVMGRINGEFAADEVLSPDEETRKAIAGRIRHWTGKELRARDLPVDRNVEAALAQSIEHQMLGLGFLEPLLDLSDTISEIMLNQDGSVWVMPKGEVNPVRAEDLLDGFVTPSGTAVRIVIDKVLGRVGRRVSEAEPVVAAKLPRSRRLPAGARVNVVIPPVANGPYPGMNIRLYEPKPVPPDQLLDWGELNEHMMDFLREAVHSQMRIMVAGGTATGKTTLLSCLAGLIPKEHRIVLVEDPAEIFVDHPHVVSLEARPPTVEGKYGIEVGDLVTTAMRMSPRWLVVGEVRHGDAAVWLMRAQMSDHPGMSTIHADDPKTAVETLCLLAMVDNEPPVRYKATKSMIVRAVDIFVQIGIDRPGVRRVKRIGQVEPQLHRGDVFITDLFLFRPEESTRDKPVWERVGELTRTRMSAR
jgi:pilus assembly protein CpaF